MRAKIDIPSSNDVIVSDHGSKYHRTGNTYETAACITRFQNGTKTITRSEAERREYKPCTNVDCFGEHLD